MLISLITDQRHSAQELDLVNKLAKSIGLELSTVAGPENYLVLDESGLKYYLSGTKGPVLALDFVSEYSSFMRQVSKTAAGPLKKAMGKGIKKDDTVVDATCGTGKDSLLFLSWGFKVLAFERHPLMFLLLQVAFEHLRRAYPELTGRFELFFGDVSNHGELLQEKKSSVLYFDPMFSELGKQKKSLPRQEMVVFSQLIGPDCDQEQVLQKLLLLPLARIVVKRPLKAAPWEGLVPLASFPGKSVRYDLFRGPIITNL